MNTLTRPMAWMAFLAGILLAVAGCGDPAGSTGTGSASRDTKKKEPVHAHPEKGPHGGPLAEWGEEEYHAEFTVDHEKKQATVYILDGEVKKPVPIEAKTIKLTITSLKPPLTMDLQADPQDGDPKGTASRFSGKDDKLGMEMNHKGDISGQVKGKPYAGGFEEKEHDHKDKK